MSGPNKAYDLKSGEYRRICIRAGGKPVWGHKQAKVSEETLKK